MTATTLDTAALLRAICAEPREDTVRLVYADALDEMGTWSVRSLSGCRWRLLIGRHARALRMDRRAASQLPDASALVVR